MGMSAEECVLQDLFQASVREGRLGHAWELLNSHPGLEVRTSEEGTGLTPLHHAAAAQDVTLAMLLYMRGADVNAQDAEGQTPLHKAVAAGNFQLICFLIRTGAMPALPDSKGEIPKALTSSPSITALLDLAERSPQEARALAANPRSIKQSPSSSSLLTPSSGCACASPASSARTQARLAKARESLFEVQRRLQACRDVPPETLTRNQRREMERLLEKEARKAAEVEKLTVSLDPSLTPSYSSHSSLSSSGGSPPSSPLSPLSSSPSHSSVRRFWTTLVGAK